MPPNQHTAHRYVESGTYCRPDIAGHTDCTTTVHTQPPTVARKNGSSVGTCNPQFKNYVATLFFQFKALIL